MAAGLDAFWIFSSPSAAVRLVWLQAALALPWSPSSVVGIRAKAKACHVLGLRMWPSDPAAAQGLMLQGLVLFRAYWRRSGRGSLYPGPWRREHHRRQPPDGSARGG